VHPPGEGELRVLCSGRRVWGFKNGGGGFPRRGFLCVRGVFFVLL
jgi:predicted Rdx family selenoprotein